MLLAGQRHIGNEGDIQTGLAGVGVGMDLRCAIEGGEPAASWLLGLWQVLKTRQRRWDEFSLLSPFPSRAPVKEILELESTSGSATA